MRGDCQIHDWQFSITSHIIKKLLKEALGITNVLQEETILSKQQRVLGDGGENSSWPPPPGFGQDWMESFNIFPSVYSLTGLTSVLFAGRVL